MNLFVGFVFVYCATSATSDVGKPYRACMHAGH